MTTFAFEPGFKAGGPIKSVAEVLDELDPSISCLLITSDRDLGDTEPFPDLSGTIVNRGRHQIFYLDRRNPGHWFAALRLTRAATPEVLYLNSFWSPYFTLLPLLASLTGLVRPRRILIAPRGEFSPGALALKQRKKRSFLMVWSRVLRVLRPTLQASSEGEAAFIRSALPWAADSIVIQTSLGPKARHRAAASSDGPRFVFVGRIARIKNVKLILEALTQVATPLALDLYGPVEDEAYWQECGDAMHLIPSNITVRYRGELQPSKVQETFAGYDGFLFPTKGENFGHVIAESLSSGCPVMCADTTPWSQLLRDGGGAVLDTFNASTWAAQIGSWASETPVERTARKQRTLESYAKWRAETRRSIAVETVVKSLHRSGSDASRNDRRARGRTAEAS